MFAYRDYTANGCFVYVCFAFFNHTMLIFSYRYAVWFRGGDDDLDDFHGLNNTLHVAFGSGSAAAESQDVDAEGSQDVAAAEEEEEEEEGEEADNGDWSSDSGSDDN